MNKISIYILLILLFLGISTNISTTDQKVRYVANERVLSGFFPGSPMSLILMDSFTTGFLIKTYYQRCKIIRGFSEPETIIIQTQKKFWKKNVQNIGMSIFRRYEKGNYESSVPMPPGTVFIGNPAFGYWQKKDSGNKVWQFHHAYKLFPLYLNWGAFRPDHNFSKHIRQYVELDQPTFGPNNEFGLKGSVTHKNFRLPENTITRKKNKLKIHLRKFFSLPRN